MTSYKSRAVWKGEQRVILRPRIVVRGSDARRVERALRSAQKYSLVAQSIRSEVRIEPEITIQKS